PAVEIVSQYAGRSMVRTVFAAAAAGLALAHGSPYADRLGVADGKREAVRCGAGRDVVVADPFDAVARGCETVSVRVRVGRTPGPGQHPSVVEPSAASSGTGVVAVFQLGRYRDGAAEANGFATSADGGRTWHSGILPGITIGGPWARASDPVVAWDALHAVWLASSLVVTRGESGLAVSRSTDGVSWAPPVAAVPNAAGIVYDKEWVTCDNWPASPRRGSCYLLWPAARARGPAASVSHEGGLTWSPAVVAARSGAIAEPITLPDGTLVVAYLAGGELSGPIVAVRSTDGGTTFSD